jgi:hypothetical protein
LKLDNFYAQKTKFLQQQPVTAFTWVFIVHTPLLGRCWNLMNIEQLCSLCQYLQRKGTPFIWPGSAAQWNGISDDRCETISQTGCLGSHYTRSKSSL